MSKITKSAQGEDCQVRIEGVCNFNNQTTVFAHLNGGGMGMKQKDLFGAYCCSSCHDEVDRRTRVYSSDYAKMCFYEGVFRTQQILIDKGLVKFY